jgi:hypothetical protein
MTRKYTIGIELNRIWKILSYFNNDKHGNCAEHEVMLMYDKLKVVGICGNKNQGEKILPLITKLNKYDTLFSRNSHYKFFPEDS